MGLYDERIFPPLLNLVMGQARLDPYRSEAVAGASGTVLEIGIGSGLNLPHYPPAAERIVGIDPSARLLSLAGARAKRSNRPATLIQSDAQSLPLPDSCVDAVVVTWSLCSIPDPQAALAEMRRVLVPGGHLHFVEHGRSPDPRIGRIQNGLTPLWRKLACGCHLNRKIDDLIETGGFRIGGLETGYMQGPRFLTYLYRGWAQPY